MKLFICVLHTRRRPVLSVYAGNLRDDVDLKKTSINHPEFESVVEQKVLISVGLYL